MRYAKRSRVAALLNVAKSDGLIVTVTPFRNYKGRQIIQHTRVTFLVRNGKKTYYKVKARFPTNKLTGAPNAIRPRR